MNTVQEPKASPAYQELEKKIRTIVGADPSDPAKVAARLKSDPEAQKKLVALLQQSKPEIHSFLTTEAAQSTAVAASTSKITAQAYWWGFHIVVPEGPLKDLYKAADVIEAFTALAGAGFAAAEVPPVAAVAAVVAALIAVEQALMKAADQGKGIYMSWTWAQVPLFPTGVAVQPLYTAIT